MSRLYVDGNSVRFSPFSFCQVTAIMYSGEKIEALEPRRLFPLSGPDEYISLLSEDGSEKMIIRSISSLDGDSAEAVRGCLGEYYRIPQITSFDGCTDKFGVLKFTVNTNFGEASFSVKNRHSDIKLLCGKRILIKDSSDNRYEVPDMNTLDKRSQKLISSYL